MTAGESIAVMVQELYEVVIKVAYTDSQAAEAILTCDGGSWRTRHLRLRSSFARQSISRGDWLIQHVAGESMIADLGTKALSAPRLEKLKNLMSMGSLKEVEEKEEEKKEGGFEKERTLREEGEDQKKSEGMKVAEAAQIIKLITLAAAISSAKAIENEKAKEDEEKIETMVACYDLEGRSTVGESCRSKAPSSITRKSPWRSEARRKDFERKRSFKPWRALRCCCPLNCLTINFFVLFSATTGSSEKCSATKRSTKGEKFSKDGSLAKCDTTTKCSTAEIKITGLKHAHR